MLSPFSRRGPRSAGEWQNQDLTRPPCPEAGCFFSGLVSGNSQDTVPLPLPWAPDVCRLWGTAWSCLISFLALSDSPMQLFPMAEVCLFNVGVSMKFRLEQPLPHASVHLLFLLTHGLELPGKKSSCWRGPFGHLPCMLSLNLPISKANSTFG